MIDSRFLESIDNLKPLIKARTDRTPSTTIAREISSCLQQGRLFYEAAVESPLEIRPLQLFYGMLGFAKALVLARTLRNLSALRHSHGIGDISREDCILAELRLKIDDSGTFQAFNDAVAPLSRVCYFNGSFSPAAEYIASAPSVDMVGVSLSLKEILSRIPTLSDLFRNTFLEEPNCIAFTLDTHGDHCTLRIADRNLFTDRESLRKIVENWRERFPFLKKWRLHEANPAWGKSLIEFENIEPGRRDEFLQGALPAHGENGYIATTPVGERFVFLKGLAPMGGGYCGGSYAIAPFNTIYFSEFSLHYLALYLLSSLVRYRPHG
jgi:hypothetical protein